MKKRLKHLGAMIILAVFAIFALRSGGDIGVLRANIERDARAPQKNF